MLKLVFTLCAFMFVAQLPACDPEESQKEIVQDALSCGKHHKKRQNKSVEEDAEEAVLSCGKHKKRQKESTEEATLLACGKCRR